MPLCALLEQALLCTRQPACCCVCLCGMCISHRRCKAWLALQDGRPPSNLHLCLRCRREAASYPEELSTRGSASAGVLRFLHVHVARLEGVLRGLPGGYAPSSAVVTEVCRVSVFALACALAVRLAHGKRAGCAAQQTRGRFSQQVNA